LKRCNENHRWLAARRPDGRGPFDRVPDVLDPAEHRRDGDELEPEGIGHESRQRRLSRTWRSPEDHRVRSAGLECDAQRLARTEQMGLSDHLVQSARPHPLRKRRRWRIGRKQISSHTSGPAARPPRI